MLEAPKPLADIGELAELTVASVQPIGTFLDWGKPKDLFLPFSERTRELRVGDRVVVFLYIDNNQRSCASMKVDKFLDKTAGGLKEGEAVELFVFAQTDLGFKAAINGRQIGMLYRTEIFKPVRVGQRLSGFVRKIREDGKIDLSLQQAGNKDVEDIAEFILSRLESNGGFLPVGDKTSAEQIYDLFGVSKKKFKMTIGGLYKKQIISIGDDGIRLKNALRKSPNS